MKQWLFLFLLLFFPIHGKTPTCTETVSPWGYHTVIDLQDCNPDAIRSRDTIESYIKVLCFLIGMKPFGDPIIVHFGEEERIAGYSLVQLIETSCVTGHFANESNSVYIDIFSCKPYNQERAVQFTAYAFKGRIKKATFIDRG